MEGFQFPGCVGLRRESEREIGGDENPQKRPKKTKASQGSNMGRPETKKKVNIRTSTAPSSYCKIFYHYNIRVYSSLCMYALLSCSGRAYTVVRSYGDVEVTAIDLLKGVLHAMRAGRRE